MDRLFQLDLFRAAALPAINASSAQKEVIAAAWVKEWGHYFFFIPHERAVRPPRQNVEISEKCK
jgi:hypothetical protein